ncbi:hypothetical protein [Candidatus Accumulibacter sp. ACC007]|uniref:hypothetical protein n=1 Tax=Candidatus Accumulibacter sp. ACC007 TaxID=2823333 RepID=UPI0025B865A4|nr:hypothetical protein [Candidatus Accumulibacter sp. ACC007]
MSEELVCRNCGHVGETKTVTKGHFALEVVLWLCFLVPGIIYSIWRLTTRYQACPVCGNANLLPMNGPMAQKFLIENLPDKGASVTEPARASSNAAVSAGQSLGRIVGKVLK